MPENPFAKFKEPENPFAKFKQEEDNAFVSFLKSQDFTRPANQLQAAVASGGVQAIGETLQTGVDLGQALYGYFTDTTPERFDVSENLGIDALTNNLVEQGSNYEYLESASRFFSGYFVGNKGITSVLGSASTRGGQFAQATAAGAYADFTTTDPFEQRVSDVLYGLTEASNDPDKATLFSELLDAFRVDKEGTALENRLKAAGEGTVLGIAADGVFGVLGKVIKNASSIQKDFGSEAASDYIDEQVKAAQSAKSATDAYIEQNTQQQVAEQIKQSLESARVREAKAGEKTPFNSETLRNLSEETQDFVSKLADETDTRGVVTREARQAAVKKTLSKMDSLEEAGRAVSEMADNVETLPEAASMSNSLLEEAADRAFRLDKEGTADEATLDEAITQTKVALESNRKIREAWGRTGQALQEGGLELGQVRKFFKDAGATDDQLKALDEFEIDDVTAEVQKRIAKERKKLEARGVYTKEEVARELKKYEQRELARAARKEAGRVRKVAEFLNTAQAASMLSGVGTQASNIASGIFLSTWRPLTRVAGGILTLNGRTIREGFGLYDGLARAIFDKETWESVGNAFVRGRTSTTLESTVERVSDWSGEGFWQWMRDNGLKSPLHLMAATDEGFQRVNAKAMARVQAKERLRVELEAGYNLLSKAEKEARIRDMVEDMFERGAVVDEYVKNYTQRITMTGPVEGGIGGALESFFRQQPVLKALIAPFLRTPMNLLREGVGSIPFVGYVSTPTKEALRSADPAVRREVLGSWALTGATMAFFAMKASNEEVTGGYSRDPRIRASQQASGIPAYSIKLGDTWYSIEKFEPIAIPLRMIMDGMVTYNNSIYDPDDDFAELFETVTMASFDSIFQGAMLKPLSDFMGIITTTDGSGLARFSEGLLTRFSPAVYQQIMAASDNGNIKTATNSIERLQRAYTPWLLPDKRSWITGEPIKKVYGADPTRSVEDKDTQKIALELQAIGGVSAPNNKLSNGTEMNAVQYDRYIEVMSTTKLGGRTLKDTLTFLVNHPQWQKRNYRTGENTSWHQRMVTKIVNRYKRVAERTLLRENEDVRTAYREKEMGRAYDKVGVTR